MKKFFRLKQSGLPLIPDELYEAKFAGYTKLKQLRYGDALRLKFEIVSGVHMGTTLDILCPDKFTPNSKFFKIIYSLIGEKAWQGVGTKELVGKKCLIQTKTVKSQKGDFSRIEKILPEDIGKWKGGGNNG